MLAETFIFAIINSDFAKSYFLKNGKIDKKKIMSELSLDDEFIKSFLKLKPAEFIPEPGYEISKSTIRKIEDQSALSLLIVFLYYAYQLQFTKDFFTRKYLWLGDSTIKEKCLKGEHISVLQMLHMLLISKLEA